MSSPATITTVLPTFQRAGLLRRAIESVLSQTYRDIHLCVYDNASADDTPSVVAELQARDPRISYHRHSENIGAAANFLFGLERIETPFFSLLSDDDVLLPTFYEAALEGFATHPAAMFSACLVITMTPDGRVRHVPFASWPRMGLFAPLEGLPQIVGGDHPTLTGVVFRADVLRECGTFDPDVTIGDIDYEIRVAARFPFVAVPEPGGIFIPHGGSTSRQISVSELWRQYDIILTKLGRDPRIAAPVRDAGAARLRRYLRHAFWRLGVRAVAEGLPGDAIVAARILAGPLDRAAAGAGLRVLAAVRAVPGLRHVLSRGYAAARAIAQRRTAGQLQQAYGHFASYLALD